MNKLRRAIVLAVSSLTVLLPAASAHAKPPAPVVGAGDVSVLTGDFDVLEDVMEHITMKRGNGPTAHQIYDHSRGGALPE
ncbi:hypothetical protein [Streptomyces poonensis]|uniref:Secreted protein n=1 Tax=Streptomyces poonensis TaxID=68255 RepID=A0A918PG77_9ACTN|nr:hypothetical protein [Streptomyces poonensis]GGZ05340.1 hypothetical protein GCM10010365_25640 [Streptomyces poonensis]GLJ89510.1 hypothetical protein GCM10017589_21100 [Streptomyces poonensis]